MAFFELEPWGSHYDDLRFGTLTSMLANIHRNEKVRRKPFGALEFMNWNDTHQQMANAPPILLEDPEAQSRLIESMMFPRRE